MKRLRFRLVLLGGFACFVAVVLWLQQQEQREQQRGDARIAVIAYSGTNSDRWRALDQGIRQACTELGVETPSVLLARSGGKVQMADLIRREVEGGARGLLLAADDGTVAACLDELTIPVVLLEGADTVPGVGADNVAMARELAEYVVGNGHVAVLCTDMDRPGIAQRYDALVARMEELGQAPTALVPEDGQELKGYLASTLATHRPAIDTLVVLENDALEVAADALPAAMVEVSLCGIGSSDKVIQELDTGVIEALLYQNEYDAGYLGILALLGELGYSTPPVTVREDMQHRLVTKENLYDKETERLLFPIMQ